jgi:hypothetical protein
VSDLFYDVGKVLSGTGGLAWMDGNWWCQAISADYIPSRAHTDISVLAGCTIGDPVPMGGQGVSDTGDLSANSVVVSGLASGIHIQALVIYHLSGGTSYLAFYLDQGPGLALITTGDDATFDFNLTPDNGLVYSY